VEAARELREKGTYGYLSGSREARSAIATALSA
jgi:hypothetical protein